MDAVGQVLQLLLADVGEFERDLVGYRLVHRSRDADAAGRRDAFQPRRDVHALAEQVAFALDDIADGDADPEMHLPAGRIREIARAQALLGIDGAAHRVDGAGELREDRVARSVEDPPAEARDEVAEHGPVVFEAPQRVLFVVADEPAETHDIGGENGCDLPLHGRTWI